MISTRSQISSTSASRCVLSIDRRAPIPGDPADESEHLALAGRIEAERRLVEEDYLRLVDEGAGDAEALPHPAAVSGIERRRREKMRGASRPRGGC